MKLALQVFKKLPQAKLFKIRSDGEPECNIFPYLNGREKGFGITRYVTGREWEEMPMVVFSEHRSSDSLFVLSGKLKEFDWNDDCKIKMSDEDWAKRKKHFEPSELQKGVDYIKKELKL